MAALIWGWDKDNKVWRPLAVNSSGHIVIKGA